jgi:hypothetical protein
VSDGVYAEKYGCATPARKTQAHEINEILEVFRKQAKIAFTGRSEEGAFHCGVLRVPKLLGGQPLEDYLSTVQIKPDIFTLPR